MKRLTKQEKEAREWLENHGVCGNRNMEHLAEHMRNANASGLPMHATGFKGCFDDVTRPEIDVSSIRGGKGESPRQLSKPSSIHEDFEAFMREHGNGEIK